MGRFVLYSFLIFAAWLIRRDVSQRDGVSRAIWIPTIWVAVIATKPISMWLGVGGAGNSLEGSPLDRLFFLVMIAAALLVLSRRNIDWGLVISRNWPIFLYYGFFLVSVLWAYSTEASSKRWFKDLGNVFLALVILTEVNPLQAIRAVFVRCAYVFPSTLLYLHPLVSTSRALLQFAFRRVGGDWGNDAEE